MDFLSILAIGLYYLMQILFLFIICLLGVMIFAKKREQR